MAEQSTNRALRSTKPNAGVRDAYAKKLRELVNALSAEVASAIKEAYGEDAPLIAQDARRKLPSEKLVDLMEKIRGRWAKRLEEEAPTIGRWFAGKVHSSVSRQKRSAVKDAGLPAAFSVNFDKGRVSDDVFNGIVQENTRLIKSIASSYLDDVEGIVMRSVTTGRDIKGLSSELSARYGVTKRRADFIARDQNNKATEALARAQDKAAGVTKGVWIHVPGKYSSRESHLKMNNKEFDLSKGLYDSEAKTWVLPGELPGCQCSYRPLFSKDLWQKK